MKRHLTLLACITLFTACGTSYKAAPSATKVATKVATARRSVQHAQSVAKEIEATTAATKVQATSTTGHLDLALSALREKGYVTVEAELNMAKESNASLLALLEQSRRNAASLSESLKTAESDLSDSQTEIERLQKQINELAAQAAKDRAVVDQVNWGFGLGAFIYGTKRILTFGFFGVLALIVVFIVLICVGGPFAAFAWRSVANILSWLRSRKSVK